MKIIIPMAGKGKRYNNVAFHGPKPLIEIDGQPMIAHVVNLFSPQDEFIFICHEEHLKNTSLRKVLNDIVPNCQIVAVDDSYLKGPTHTCQSIFNLIDDDEEIIINYCDFVLSWNYKEFLKVVRNRENDGAIPSFRGFHPASLGETYYAYLKVDASGYLTDLREKQAFSADRMEDYASTGTYYFKKGSTFKKYAQKVIETDFNVQGETYVTLPYMLMIKDGLKVLNYEVEKFICLGTPRDYEIYKFWSEFFFRRSGQVVGFNNVNLKTTNIFPIAGAKYDFKSIGLEEPNFLIPLMNKPLITSTIKSYPKGIKNIFICLEEDKQRYGLGNLFEREFHNPEIISLNHKTGGNAETLLKAENVIEPNAPICVSGNDYILDYDERRLSHLMEKDVDVILLAFTHHECVLRNSHNHSYLSVKNGQVVQISEKKIISETPYQDYAFTGTAIYKKSEDLFGSIKKHIEGDNPPTPYFLTAVNQLIKEGKKVMVFEVDKFVSFMNPTDYQEFAYWQDYFENLGYHPYSKMIH